MTRKLFGALCTNFTVRRNTQQWIDSLLSAVKEKGIFSGERQSSQSLTVLFFVQLIH